MTTARSTETQPSEGAGCGRRRPLRVGLAPPRRVSMTAMMVAAILHPATVTEAPPFVFSFFAEAFRSVPASGVGCRWGRDGSVSMSPSSSCRCDGRHGCVTAALTADTAFCHHQFRPFRPSFRLSVTSALEEDSSSLTYSSHKRGRRRRRVVNGKRKSFDDWYRELSAYRDVHGDCLVPQSGQYAPLGRWVARQRLLHKRREAGGTTAAADGGRGGGLTDERMRRLDDLGFCWEVRDAQWNLRYEQLRKFHRLNGHCRVPLDNVGGTVGDGDADASHDLTLLHHWTNEQRKRYRRKAQTPERIRKLNEIEFPWFAPSSHSVLWREKFDELCEYRMREGDCMVPKTYGPNPELGYWVTRQRERYKLRHRNHRSDAEGYEGETSSFSSSSSSGSTAATSAPITDEQVDMLNSIGFVWDASRSEWNRWYRELLQCIESNGGDTNIVDSDDGSGGGRDAPAAVLRTWVETQRNQVRRHLGGRSCVLSEAQLGRLRSIDGLFFPSSPAMTDEVSRMPPPPPSMGSGLQRAPNGTSSAMSTKRTKRDDERWEDMFDRLCEYLSVHGDTLVPLSYDADLSLGSWVRNQREQHRRLLNGEYTFLTPERVEALDGVGFVWRVDRWRARYDDLRDYVAVHGDADVPEFYPDNVPLGVWVANQRTQRRYMDEGMRTTLTDERVAALDRLGFRWSWAASNWLDMLGWLKRYKAEHGHLYVSPTDEENRSLRLWASHQRHQYRKLKGRHEQGRSVASTMTPERIRALEDIGFEWRVQRKSKLGGPSAEDWSKLFQGMRGSGIDPERSRAKVHWFDGVPRTDDEGWDVDEAELLRLWNEEDEETNNF